MKINTLPPEGAYVLIIKLKMATIIRVGALGTQKFKKGYYTYTGSARRALPQRVSRHLRKKKRKRWHIDYLLSRAKVVEIAATQELEECKINELLINVGGKILVKGFGSSDCRCPTHLLFWGDEDPTEKVKVTLYSSHQF